MICHPTCKAEARRWARCREVSNPEAVGKSEAEVTARLVRVQVALDGGSLHSAGARTCRGCRGCRGCGCGCTLYRLLRTRPSQQPCTPYSLPPLAYLASQAMVLPDFPLYSAKSASSVTLGVLGCGIGAVARIFRTTEYLLFKPAADQEENTSTSRRSCIQPDLTRPAVTGLIPRRGIEPVVKAVTSTKLVVT